MRRFSIIVPVWSDHASFETTLGSVLRYLPKASRVVVPCPFDYDDPCRIEGEVDFVRFEKPAIWDLATCWQAGLTASGEELVVWLIPGTELAGGWDSFVSGSFDDSDVAVVSACIHSGSSEPVGGLRVDRNFWFRAVRIAKTTAPLIDAPMPAAVVFRNDVLGWVSGLCPVSGATAQIETALMLQYIGYRTVCCRDWLVTVDSAGRIDTDLINTGLIRERLVRRFSKNSGGMIWRLLRDALQGQAVGGLARIKAGKFREEDEQFASELAKAKIGHDRLKSSAKGLSPKTRAA